MPNQNFFDEQNPQSTVILEEDTLSSSAEHHSKHWIFSPIALVGIGIVVVFLGVFFFLMKIPVKPSQQGFEVPTQASVSSSQETTTQDTQVEDPPIESQSESVQSTVAEEWNLRLVNNQHSLPEDYGEQEMTAFGGGYYFDARIIEFLEQLLDAAKQENLNIKVVSGYRGVERQTTRNQDEIAAYTRRGYSEQDAVALANMEQPPYLQSEHSLGLSVDLLDSGSSSVSIAFEQTDEFKWLIKNAAQYGFILRYPEDKVEVTGMVYKPWHFRYVGREHAEKIQQQGLCLEEYLQQISG